MLIILRGLKTSTIAQKNFREICIGYEEKPQDIT